MKTIVTGITAAFAMIASSSLYASDFTLNIHREKDAASHMVCYTDFEIDFDGNWTAKSMYSNGAQWNSGRFYSVIYVKAKDGRPVITIPQNHHVRGSHMGSAREERTQTGGKLPAAVARLISKDNADYSCQMVSDIDFNKLKQAAEIAAWVLTL